MASGVYSAISNEDRQRSYTILLLQGTVVHRGFVCMRLKIIQSMEGKLN